jgi:hypothetical protein
MISVKDAATVECYALNGNFMSAIFLIPPFPTHTSTDFVHACDSRHLILLLWPWMWNERSKKILEYGNGDCSATSYAEKPSDLYHGTQLIFIIIVLPRCPVAIEKMYDMHGYEV